MKECLALRKPLQGERAMIMIEYRKYRKTIPAAIDLLQNRRIAGVERWCMGWFLILGQMVAGAEEIRVFFARDGWLTSLNNRLIYCRMEGLGWLGRGPFGSPLTTCCGEHIPSQLTSFSTKEDTQSHHRVNIDLSKSRELTVRTGAHGRWSEPRDQYHQGERNVEI